MGLIIEDRKMVGKFLWRQGSMGSLIKKLQIGFFVLFALIYKSFKRWVPLMFGWRTRVIYRRRQILEISSLFPPVASTESSILLFHIPNSEQSRAWKMGTPKFMGRGPRYSWRLHLGSLRTSFQLSKSETLIHKF